MRSSPACARTSTGATDPTLSHSRLNSSDRDGSRFFLTGNIAQALLAAPRREGQQGAAVGRVIPLASVLPTFMAPSIHYEAPSWHARVNGRRSATITVQASTRIEAKYRGAQHFGCAVQLVLVQAVDDPKLSRFNRVA